MDKENGGKSLGGGKNSSSSTCVNSAYGNIQTRPSVNL